MTIAVERLDELVTALRTVLRDEQILTSKPDRYNRARVPAPFPVHRWAERLPDLAVLPTSTEEVAGVVRIANELRVPVVPRDGGTGLTDGAVPLHGGIVVDVKRMNAIKELDLENRTVTVGTGISMLKLNEQLAKHGLFYPDDPASYPCSLVGGRIGTSGWSLIGSRYGHTRDLVLSFDHVLPTGEVMHVGDGIGHKVSKSSSGYQLKHLFMGHQGTLGIATEATLKLFPKPEAELSPFWAFDNYDDAYKCVGALARAGVATFAGAVLFDEYKVAYLRRDDEAYIPQPGDVRALVCAVMYGYEDEVRPAGKRLFRIAKEHGARYLGDEISEGDWAARHDRYATPLHGRTKAGQVVPMSWHCEDAAINYTNLPSVSKAWHEIIADLRRRTDVFDDWGMFAYTSGNTGVDYLTEIDVGIWEQQLDDRAWEMWVKAKRDIAAVSLAHGGSISACHGSCREGEVDLVPDELGRGFDVMLDLKRTLDPNNIMNPGKYLLDRAYDDGDRRERRPTMSDASRRRRADRLPVRRAVHPARPGAGLRRRHHHPRARLRGRPAADGALGAAADVPQLGLAADHEQPRRPPRVDAPALRPQGRDRLGAAGRGRRRGRPAAMSRVDSPEVPDDETARLEALGYTSEFKREMSMWANFSLGFTYLSPVVATYTLFGIAIATRRPADDLVAGHRRRRPVPGRARLRRGRLAVPRGRWRLPVGTTALGSALGVDDRLGLPGRAADHDRGRRLRGRSLPRRAAGVRGRHQLDDPCALRSCWRSRWP